jgi:hypothetical protein
LEHAADGCDVIIAKVDLVSVLDTEKVVVVDTLVNHVVRGHVDVALNVDLNDDDIVHVDFELDGYTVIVVVVVAAVVVDAA